MVQNLSDFFEIETTAPEEILYGVQKEKDGIRFTISHKPGSGASLLLYEKNGDKKILEAKFPDTPVMGSVYSMKIKALPWKKYEYNIKTDGIVRPDTTARQIRRTKEKEARSVFYFEEYDWSGDSRPDILYEDAVMYHAHVRNFTKDPRSGVRHKGTFKGLQEKIDYLKELGINQIKLMPIYEYDESLKKEAVCKGMPKHLAAHLEKTGESETEEMRKNCWGYAKAAYYAPKASYAATENPVRECKDMIRAFHANGIEVILEMFFTEDMPGREILHILTYWAKEYHVDGFSFVGRSDFVKLLLSDPFLAGCKLLGESYPGGEIQESDERVFAECNDGFQINMRRLLKGDEGMLEAFAYHSRRNPAAFGCINYITNHDGFTLQDLVSYDQKHNEENGENGRDGAMWNFSWNCGAEGPTKKKSILTLRRRMMKNAFLMMFLSQGTPMILSGDEFGNSQNGNNNPYCLDNATAWVNWKERNRNKDLLEFVRQAIAFRKEHRILHPDKEFQLTDYQSVGMPDLSYHSKRAWYGGFEYESRQIGLLYNGAYSGEEGMLYVAYNFHSLPQELALPKLKADMCWHLLVDTSKEESFLAEGEQTISNQERSCIIPERTIQVFWGKKE